MSQRAPHPVGSVPTPQAKPSIRLLDRAERPVRLTVLGPLDVVSDRRSHVPGAPKLRQVLALLLLNAGHVVPVTALFRELWEDDPPASALRIVQTYVGQLRRLLAGALEVSVETVRLHHLTTRGHGYQLNLALAELDLRTFRRLADRGRQAMAGGEIRAAEKAFAEALALWHGPCLANVTAGPLLSAQIERLEESRFALTYDQLQAKLDLGHAHEIVGEVSALAAERPLDEDMHALLITVLARCGRRGAALDVFRRLRARLGAELGLEPSAMLVDLQQAVLNGQLPATA